MWFCDLSEAKTLSDIISQVGYALSIPLTTGRSDDELLNQIGAQLGERANTLLILDNLEQVIDPAARAIERWLSATGSLCLLATSQERLRLSAETVSAVRSLSVEEGVELFCARRSLRSDFEVTVGQRGAARADRGGARLHAACDRAGRCADPPHERRGAGASTPAAARPVERHDQQRAPGAPSDLAGGDRVVLEPS